MPLSDSMTVDVRSPKVTFNISRLLNTKLISTRFIFRHSVLYVYGKGRRQSIALQSAIALSLALWLNDRRRSLAKCKFQHYIYSPFIEYTRSIFTRLVNGKGRRQSIALQYPIAHYFQ